MKGLILSLFLFGTAAADSYERAPRPYELVGVKLPWFRIPWDHTPILGKAGWRFYNPTGVALEKFPDGTRKHCDKDWFNCRICVDPIAKTLTILTATECDEP
jgi:hypothetical protein